MKNHLPRRRTFAVRNQSAPETAVDESDPQNGRGGQEVKAASERMHLMASASIRTQSCYSSGELETIRKSIKYDEIENGDDPTQYQYEESIMELEELGDIELQRDRLKKSLEPEEQRTPQPRYP